MHRLVQLRLGWLAVADGFGQPRARLLLDRVVGGQILFERARHHGDADLGVAEFDEAAVLEPVDDGPREELDLADRAGHHADSTSECRPPARADRPGRPHSTKMSAPHTPAPNGYHSAAPPTARTRSGRRAVA